MSKYEGYKRLPECCWVRNRRDWLNQMKHEDTGAIAYTCELDTNITAKGKVDTYFHSTLTLWDCSRRIDLSFSCDIQKASQVNARLKKIATIRAYLEDLENILIEGYDSINRL